MREHLYKAKRVNWRELPKEEWWVEGNLLASDDDYYIIPDFGVSCVEKLNNYVCDKLITLHAFEVDKETVCEYTQMTNINKNKIWENDIVKHDVTDTIGSVKWYCEDYIGWCVYDVQIGEQQFTNEMWDECEIIGNIFDNLELLEGGKVE